MGSTVHKKGGPRRMTQMNGDFLSQLKEPRRSEMNRIVIGTNKSFVSSMNKKLDMYYKDKNFMLEKIRRKQDAVFGTMLRVDREKKILQRAMHKQRQEEHRQAHNKAAGTINILTVDPMHEESTKKDIIPIEDKPEATVAEYNPSPKPRTFERKSKALEVSKKTPLAPIAREKSDLGNGNVTNTTQKTKTSLASFSDIHTQLLPEVKSLEPTLPPLMSNERNIHKEPSMTDMAIDSVAVAQSTTGCIPKPSDSLPKVQNPVVSRRMSKSTALPTISEGENSRDLVTRHSDDMVYDKNPKRTKKSSRSSEHQSETEMIRTAFGEETSASDDGEARCTAKQPISLVQLNKRRARAKLRRQQKEIKNERVIVYIKDEKGNYKPSDAEFKRKEFKPPSLKEKRFQERMIQSEVDVRLNQRKRLEAFFERMAHEEREKQRIRDAFKRQMVEDEDRAREAMKTEGEKLGFSSAQMATLFSKGVLPDGIDPSSFEAIKYCKYIRTFSPNAAQMAKRKAAREGKVSSWDNVR